MARVVQSGFENGGRPGEWGTGGTGTFDTTIVRTGTYSLKGAGSLDFMISTLTGFSAESYTREYVYTTGVPSSLTIFLEVGPIQLFNQSSGIGLLGGTGGGNVHALGVFPLNRWVCIEVRAKSISTGGASDGIAVVKIDGQVVAEDLAFNAPFSGEHRVKCGCADGVGIDFYHDDVAQNSTSGALNNSWCGPGACVNLALASDTATINWTTTGASHFGELDDWPASTTDTTTYISTVSKTDLFEDRWNFSDTPSVLTGNAIISALCVGVVGGGTATQSRTAKFQARDASDNTVDGTDVNWNLNGYKVVYPILIREQTWQATPVALSKSYLDGMSGAAIETNTSNNEIRWTAVWATIDYGPGPPLPPRFVRPFPFAPGSSALTR